MQTEENKVYFLEAASYKNQHLYSLQYVFTSANNKLSNKFMATFI